MPSLLVIANASAGGIDEPTVSAALGSLRDAYEVEVQHTATIDDLLSAVEGRGSRDLVVVGGDGSLHAVTNVLHRVKQLRIPAVGLIPLGTGNDFARALGIPLDPVGAAEVIVRGHHRKVDVLLDENDGVVVNAVHAGVGADAGSAARPWKGIGRFAYATGAVLAGLTAEGSKIRVVADGRVIADGRRLLQVGITNGPTVGGGLPLAPDADPTDGLCDVMVSFAVKPVDRLLYGLRLRRGDHDERSDVTVTKAAIVSLSGRKAFWCDADGEIVGPITSNTWTVSRSALTMFAPPAESL